MSVLRLERGVHGRPPFDQSVRSQCCPTDVNPQGFRGSRFSQVHDASPGRTVQPNWAVPSGGSGWPDRASPDGSQTVSGSHERHRRAEGSVPRRREFDGGATRGTETPAVRSGGRAQQRGRGHTDGSGPAAARRPGADGGRRCPAGRAPAGTSRSVGGEVAARLASALVSPCSHSVSMYSSGTDSSRGLVGLRSSTPPGAGRARWRRCRGPRRSARRPSRRGSAWSPPRPTGAVAAADQEAPAGEAGGGACPPG